MVLEPGSEADLARRVQERLEALRPGIGRRQAELLVTMVLRIGGVAVIDGDVGREEADSGEVHRRGNVHGRARGRRDRRDRSRRSACPCRGSSSSSTPMNPCGACMRLTAFLRLYSTISVFFSSWWTNFSLNDTSAGVPRRRPWRRRCRGCCRRGSLSALASVSEWESADGSAWESASVSASGQVQRRARASRGWPRPDRVPEPCR